MDINELTLGQIKQLQSVFGSTHQCCDEHIGMNIVIADRGHVYVGDCTRKDNGDILIKNAGNIRRWGTSKGLGELALEGKKENTIVDPYSEVRVNASALINTIKCEHESWISTQ